MKICAVDACEKEAKARGWCKMHWKRWRVHGSPDYVAPPPPPRLKCAVDGCEKNKHGYVYCSMHYGRWKKHGDPLIVGDHYPGRPRLDTPTYSGMHKRIFYDRGPASNYPCSECGEQAQEWSYDGLDPSPLEGTVRGSKVLYSLDQSHYLPRCKKCHRARDYSNVRRRASNGQWAPTPNPRLTKETL